MHFQFLHSIFLQPVKVTKESSEDSETSDDSEDEKETASKIKKNVSSCCSPLFILHI